jgi:hypothetical protein
MVEIRLEQLTRGEVNVLSGHERGLTARSHFDMDRLDASGEHVDIVIPDTLEAVTPSFVQGFLGRSFNSLGGKSAVMRRYHLIGRALVIDDFLAGIDRLGFDRKALI